MDEVNLPVAKTESLQDAVKRVELRDVVALRVHGERTQPGPTERVELSLRHAVALNPNRLDYRFDCDCSLISEEGEERGQVSVTMVAVCAVAGEDISEEVARELGERVIFPVVYPYVREAVQELAGRVGFRGLTLGLFRAQDGGIGGVSLQAE